MDGIRAGPPNCAKIQDFCDVRVLDEILSHSDGPSSDFCTSVMYTCIQGFYIEIAPLLLSK